MYYRKEKDSVEDSTTQITPQTNHAGGTLGGISTGQDIYFNVAFKPASSIATPQQTHTISGESVELKTHGRHDPCVVTRAVPVVEAMTSMCILDMVYRAKCA